jgi:hypothetical protein
VGEATLLESENALHITTFTTCTPAMAVLQTDLQEGWKADQRSTFALYISAVLPSKGRQSPHGHRQQALRATCDTKLCKHSVGSVTSFMVVQLISIKVMRD